MATTATKLIYLAAGEPLLPGNTVGMCRTCGDPGRGIRFSDWVKDGFTNHDLLRTGDIVCHACLFCFDDRSLALQQITGKEKPQKFRNYSHFVVDGKWIALSKADKATMRGLLARSPSVAIIADSGQKHLAFRARPGWWQFEEFCFLPCWDKVSELFLPIEQLINGGFSKGEIESGDYALYRIHKFGMARWHSLTQPLLAIRKTIYFQLALFLSQKAVDE